MSIEQSQQFEEIVRRVIAELGVRPASDAPQQAATPEPRRGQQEQEAEAEIPDIRPSTTGRSTGYRIRRIQTSSRG